MKMRLKVSLALLLALLVIPGASYGGVLGIGGHLGYFKVSADGEKTIYGGGHVRLRLPILLSFEGALDYRPSASRDVTGVPGGELDVTTYPITISALGYPFPGLYLLAGIGWYNTTIELAGSGISTGPSSDTHDNLGFHAGAGLELPVGSNASLSGDVRYVFLDYDVSDLKIAGLSDLDANYVSFGIGITFYY
jgi:opacity protein-like surface antigen